ncbi:MAG: ribonuclease domain-containing protein [Pseudomonadota bacterium]
MRTMQFVTSLVVSAGLFCTIALTDAGASAAWARSRPAATTEQTITVGLSQLPAPAQDVHRRIHAGGPFRYAKDGSVFGNRERALPRRQRGFYHEYTVPTPGSRDRGARRIVCGGQVVQSPETCFYSEDHYYSFSLIDPRR